MSEFETPPEGIPQNEAETAAIEDAVIFIEEAKQYCTMLGANDMEIPAFIQLIKDVKIGNIDPAEAKKQAAQIKGSKMDYR